MIGGAAEFATSPLGNLIRIPDGVSFEDAAALPIAYGTAHRMILNRGRVTKDEVKAQIHKRLERKIEHIFARFDANEDGEMTKPELEAQIDVHFKRIDQNEDGVVSQDELKEFRRGFRKHMRKFFLKNQ